MQYTCVSVIRCTVSTGFARAHTDSRSKLPVGGDFWTFGEVEGIDCGEISHLL